jgi:hypothetical protein
MIIFSFVLKTVFSDLVVSFNKLTVVRKLCILFLFLYFCDRCYITLTTEASLNKQEINKYLCETRFSAAVVIRPR